MNYEKPISYMSEGNVHELVLTGDTWNPETENMLEVLAQAYPEPKERNLEAQNLK